MKLFTPRVHSIFLLTALLQLTFAASNSVAADELFEFISPDEMQTVITREEFSYEETCYFAKDNRCRVARVNLALLEKPGSVFTMTLFEDMLPLPVKSDGSANIASGMKIWTGRWENSVPEQYFPTEDGGTSHLKSSPAHNAWVEEWDTYFNTIEITIQKFLYDDINNNWRHVPNGYERYLEQYDRVVAEKSENGPDLRTSPIGSANGPDDPRVAEYDTIKSEMDQARISILGEIRRSENADGAWPTTYNIKSFDSRNKSLIDSNGYVLIYELDPDKVIIPDERCHGGACSDGQRPLDRAEDIERNQKLVAFSNHMENVKQRIANRIAIEQRAEQ